MEPARAHAVVSQPTLTHPARSITSFGVLGLGAAGVGTGLKVVLMLLTNPSTSVLNFLDWTTVALGLASIVIALVDRARNGSHWSVFVVVIFGVFAFLPFVSQAT